MVTRPLFADTVGVGAGLILVRYSVLVVGLDSRWQQRPEAEGGDKNAQRRLVPATKLRFSLDQSLPFPVHIDGKSRKCDFGLGRGGGIAGSTFSRLAGRATRQHNPLVTEIKLPGPIVSVSWLATHREHARVVVLDASINQLPLRALRHHWRPPCCPSPGLDFDKNLRPESPCHI